MTDSKITVFENELAVIWCYPDNKIIHHQFHKSFFDEDFRQILSVGADAFETYKCTKWLSDDRNFGAILPENKKWGDEYWRPRMIKSGWKYWAMVLPQKTTGKMNIARMVEEYEQLGITASYHDDPKSAMTWLLEQK